MTDGTPLYDDNDNNDEYEAVNHPAHYHSGTYEAINVIDAWNLNFNLGNAVKYIARAGYKGDRIEDLKKAVWYIQHEIDNSQ